MTREEFESVKDHVFKLAGDYKCWDNRLTHEEAVELCHMLEQRPCEDAISRQAAIDTANEAADKWDGGFSAERSRIITEALNNLPFVKPQESCSDCCNGNQTEKARLCQKSYLAGMEHKQEPKTGR